MSLDPLFEKLLSLIPGLSAEFRQRRAMRRRSLRLAMVLAAACWSGISTQGFAQEGVTDPTAGEGDFVIQAQAEFYEEETGKQRRAKKNETTEPTGNGADAEEGLGTMMRVDHLFGNTVGRRTGLTPMEVVPYRLFDNDMWFGSVRFAPNDKGRLAGSSGLGYRYFDDTITRVFGASMWYDLDDSSTTTFQQFGASFETYGESWDARSNIYVPFGDTSDVLSRFVNPGSTRYSGHSIIFDQTTVSVTAMPGHDGEIGIPIQGEFGDKHDIRAYAGYYHFFRSGVPEIWGWRTRVEAHILPQVEVQVQGSGDDVYGTNVMVGVAWLYSGGMYDKPEQARKSPYGRMGEWVRRNYNIVSPEQRIVDAGLTAINPATGTPYVVQHVDTNSGNSDGSFEDPFHTVAQAQAAGADIILVRSGSTLSGSDASIVLQDGQMLLGDATGVEHWIPTSQFASFLLPHASNGTTLPTLLNATGDSVTLASNSTLAGFRIEGPTGSGIFANGITNAIVRDVDIVNAGANGIDLHNIHGNLDFTRTHVEGANATVVNPLLTNSSGLRIEGGDAEVKFDGMIENSAGNQVAVIGTTGGHVDLTKAIIQSNVGGGVAVRDAAGDVTFKDVTLSNTIGDGISVQGGNGTVRFLGQTSLTSVFGKGVKIDGVLDGGLVQFDNLWMDQRQDVGIELNNIGGSVQFLGNTVIQAGSGINTAGIDFQNSSGAVTFNNIDLVGGGAGIHMGSLLNENTGSFQVNGTTNISSVSGPGIHIYDDSASVLFNRVEIANRQAEGILIDGGRGYVQFTDTVGISNGL
ncbi:MAG: right-handed parallel beta-helix repeat-containing protein, partial [Planctomycetaceae bacterium]|nr:right-handed parallel beta-helix repeat-containing protein [Planctomycetaceae bacterium]